MASPGWSALDALSLEINALPDGATWIRGALMKRLIEALVRDRARGGANVDEVPTPKGRFLNAQAGGDAAAAEPGAFDLSISVTNGAAQARFTPGAVNNLVPDNILQPFAVSGQLSYVIVRANTDGQSVQNCTLMISGTAPDSPAPLKNALPAQVDVLLHLIEYTPSTDGSGAGTYTPHRVFYPRACVSLTSVEVLRTTRDDSDGGLPYDPWYTWQIGAYSSNDDVDH